MKKGKQPVVPELVWHEENRTLTLEGEPVLSYRITWPQLTGAGLGGRWIGGYYARMAEHWRLRWQREVYWLGCIQLAQRRAASRPFIPWTGKLEGTMTFWDAGKLSIRMVGEETRGDGKPCRVQWGDVWTVREGAPCRTKELFQGRRPWKKAALEQIVRQGEARQAAGELFLDGAWEWTAKKLLPHLDCCLTGEGLEFAYPQCAIAPAAEGTPVFQVTPTPAQPPST